MWLVRPLHAVSGAYVSVALSNVLRTHTLLPVAVPRALEAERPGVSVCLCVE